MGGFTTVHFLASCLQYFGISMTLLVLLVILLLFGDYSWRRDEASSFFYIMKGGGGRNFKRFHFIKESHKNAVNKEDNAFSSIK
jgi:hypothetical protein